MLFYEFKYTKTKFVHVYNSHHLNIFYDQHEIRLEHGLCFNGTKWFHANSNLTGNIKIQKLDMKVVCIRSENSKIVKKKKIETNQHHLPGYYKYHFTGLVTKNKHTLKKIISSCIQKLH